MRNYILTFCALATLILPTYGQHHKVVIRNTTVTRAGDNIELSFEMMPGRIPSNTSVTVSPVIYNGEGKWMSTRPVTLTGKKKNITDLRAGRAEGDRRIVSRKNDSTIAYRAIMPYEPWMNYISVSARQTEEWCRGNYEHPVTPVSKPILLRFDITPFFSLRPLRYELTPLEEYDLDNPFLHPTEDYASRYEILSKDRGKGSSVLSFKVGSDKIDMDLQDNRDVLEALSKAFELIENDPNATLKHITIAGYASPEGSLSFNTALARRRAEAVKAFIKRLTRITDDLVFELYNGREDWNGLREMVDKSFMPERDQVLAIIDAYPMEREERKLRLKQLAGGEPYRYMLEHFYPALRSAGYVQVYYEIDRKAGIATVVTDEHGRATRIDPGSSVNRSVTALNKGLELVVDSKYGEALEELLNHHEDPRSWNLIGVCYMMLGDYATASTYLEQAAANGDGDAQRNLEQIAWSKRVVK